MRLLIAQHPAQPEVSKLAGEAAPVIAGALQHDVGGLQVTVNLQRGWQSEAAGQGREQAVKRTEGTQGADTQAGRNKGRREI
jgi:protein involved in temperature-dependent protein secretion